MEVKTSSKTKDYSVTSTTVLEILNLLRVDQLLIESQDMSLFYEERRQKGQLSHQAIIKQQNKNVDLEVQIDDLYQELKGHFCLQLNPQTRFSVSYENFVATAQLNHIYQKKFTGKWGQLSLIQSSGLSETGRSTLLRSDTTLKYTNNKMTASLTATNLLNRQDSYFSYRAGGSGNTEWNLPDPKKTQDVVNFQPLSSEQPDAFSLNAHFPLLGQNTENKGWTGAIDAELKLSTHQFEPSLGKLSFTLSGGKKQIKSISGTITYKKDVLRLDLKADMIQSGIGFSVEHAHITHQNTYTFTYSIKTWKFNLGATVSPTNYQAKAEIQKELGNDRGALAIYVNKGARDWRFGFNLLYRF